MNVKYVPAHYEVTVTRRIEVGRSYNISPSRGYDIPRTTADVTAVGTPREILASGRIAARQVDWGAWAEEADDDVASGHTPFVLFLYTEGEDECETVLPLEEFVAMTSERY